MTSFDPFKNPMPDETLEDYLLLCQEIFLTMQKDGSWPWQDSQNSEDLVESDDS